MKTSIFSALIFVLNFSIYSQEPNLCDCFGPIRPVHLIYPLENFKQNSSYKSNIFLEMGVPFMLTQQLQLEAPRLAPNSILICGDANYELNVTTSFVLWPTKVYQSNGTSSLKMANNHIPALDPYYAFNIHIYDPSLAKLLETDIVFNTYNVDYTKIGRVISRPSSLIDAGTIMRHELGHFCGADHDDYGTLMYESLKAGEIIDIDCDIQDAYANLYFCSMLKNFKLCPNMLKGGIWLGYDYIIDQKSRKVIFNILNKSIKNIYIYASTKDRFQIVKKINVDNNQLFFDKIDSKKDYYFQLDYGKSLSELKKM